MEIQKEIDPSSLSLNELKAYRFGLIDSKTEKLISVGFTYQGKVFSMSVHSQINLSSLDQSRLDMTLQYPIAYNTINDNDKYMITDAVDLHNMYLSALNFKKNLIDAGTSLKDLIRAATTIEEVNTVEDNR